MFCLHNGGQPKKTNKVRVLKRKMAQNLNLLLIHKI